MEASDGAEEFRWRGCGIGGKRRACPDLKSFLPLLLTLRVRLGR